MQDTTIREIPTVSRAKHKRADRWAKNNEPIQLTHTKNRQVVVLPRNVLEDYMSLLDNSHNIVFAMILDAKTVAVDMNVKTGVERIVVTEPAVS